MRIAGNYTFAATRKEVWSALNDPEMLARAIPGCQRFEVVGENEYESTVQIEMQVVRGTYTGRVRIDNIVSPESYDIHVDGQGSSGFLKGAGTVKLRTDGAQTILDYGGEAVIGGAVAGAGQQLLDSAARSLISQSLQALARQIEERRLHASEQRAEAEAALAEEAPPAHPETPMAFRKVASPLPPGDARRTITVAEGQGLSEDAVVRDTVEDFFTRHPWLPWMLVAFLLGYILGRRKT
ncbi:MAG: carbon monoxide dehydrogenase subunit G [Chloroflexaceae bacterium]